MAFKLDFSGLEVNVRPEELERKTSKFMREGRQDVTIKAVDVKGPCQRDPNWVDVVYTLANAAGQEVRHFIRLPLKSLKFKDDKYGNNLKDFMALCIALGFDAHLGRVTEKAGRVESEPSNLPLVLSKYFAQPEKQVGLSLTIVAGYRNYNAKYVGKEGDKSVYALASADGTVVNNTRGEKMTFSDHASVEAYCANNNMRYDPFVRVLKVIAPAQPNDLSAFEPKVKAVVDVD